MNIKNTVKKMDKMVDDCEYTIKIIEKNNKDLSDNDLYKLLDALERTL